MGITTESKYLALILRHKPEELNLALDSEGWCNVVGLVNAFKTKFTDFTEDTLEQIVSTDNKGGYQFNSDHTLVRAVQGHSLKSVNITFEEVDWDVMQNKLFHGTAEKYLESILNIGLIPKSRQYVHLSSDKDTAIKVGKRHGAPVVLKIDTTKMKSLGYKLYKAGNGVYLTPKVSVECIEIIK